MVPGTCEIVSVTLVRVAPTPPVLVVAFSLTTTSWIGVNVTISGHAVPTCPPPYVLVQLINWTPLTDPVRVIVEPAPLKLASFSKSSIRATVGSVVITS